MTLCGCLLLAGCSTPDAVKELSSVTAREAGALADSYKADLGAARDFAVKSHESLGRLKAEAEHRGEALQLAVTEIMRLQAQAVRARLLSEFNQRALRLLSLDFDAALNERFWPTVNARSELLSVERKQVELVAMRDRGDAVAQERYGRATFELLLFQRKAMERVNTLRTNTQFQVQKARDDFAAELDDALRDFVTEEAPRSLGLLLQKLSGKGEEVDTNLVTGLIQPINERLLAVQGFQNSLANALAKLDDYLRSDGYRLVYTEAFLRGLFLPVRDKLAELKQTLLPKLSLPGPLAELSESGFDKLVDGLEKFQQDTPVMAQKLNDKLNSTFNGLETRIFARMGSEASQAVGEQPGAAAR